MRMKMWAEFVAALVVLFALDAGLIFAPTFAPVPRQGAKPAAKNSGQIGGNSYSNKQPSPLLPAGNGIVQAEPQTKHGEEVAGHDKQQQITVVSLPEVSVSSDYKGWIKRFYDWGPWAFGGLVAVFSGFQIWLLKLTLNRVSRQADVANRQAVIMVHQVEEMRKVSEIENKTLVLQFRPRVIVRNAKATGLGIEPDIAGVCKLEFLLVNIGGSTAHVMEGCIYFLSVIASDIEHIQFKDGTEWRFGQGSLQPGQRYTLKNESMETGTVNDAEWMLYYSGKSSSRYIILMGTVWYRDEIGIIRQTGLHRVFDVKTGRFEPKKDSEEEYSD
jgi:hypothetical protein